MSTAQDFATAMAGQSEHELFGILANRDEYVPEALEAAAAELSKRDLSVEQTAQLRALQEQNLLELCPHCLKQVSFAASSVCVHCSSDKTLVRFACPDCAKVMDAPRDAAGGRVKCRSCGTDVLVPNETSDDLIIESGKTKKEFCDDLMRLRAAFLKAGLDASEWEDTLVDLVNMQQDQLVGYLRRKDIECTTARAGARAIQFLEPSLRPHVTEAINKNIISGGLFFVGGILVTLLSYFGAVRSGGIYHICCGAIIMGGAQLFMGLRQAREADDPDKGPRCVSCAAPIVAGTKTCSNCGWTQPI